MRIAELVESLDLPETQVAERAWAEGRGRVRRRRGAVAACAAAVSVACVVSVVVLVGRDHEAAPAPSHPLTSSQATGAPVVQRLVTGGAWRDLVRGFPLDRLPAIGDMSPLVDDPVPHAALVMVHPVDDTVPLVLGDEDRLWRQVQRPRLVPVRHAAGYLSPVVRPGSVSPDATRLAIPQPDSLVVVDLTDGSFRRYAVPGKHNTFVTWADSDHVLVVRGGAQHGVLVDLRDGSLADTAYGPSTAFTGGTTLTWGAGGPTHSTLGWGDGRRIHTLADNGGGLFPQPPLVKDDLVVGIGGLYADDPAATPGTIGVNVVDGSTGTVLASLPLTRASGTPSSLLGWEGEDPIVGLSVPQSQGYLYVCSWDWRAGRLHPIVRVADWTAWGTGKVS